MPVVGIDELLALAGDPSRSAVDLSPTGGGWLQVDLDHAPPPRSGGSNGVHTTTAAPRSGVGGLPYVVIGVGDGEAGVVTDGVELCDVVVADGEAASVLTAAVDAHPVAATALAMLLRGGERRSVAEGLVAESATYSMLQAGADHQAWLGSRRRRQRPPRATNPAPVRVERDGGRLLLTLSRPEVRNAFDAATRDALLEGLAVATADPSITEVVLAGGGPSFCAGGDLDEFGTATDPSAAHLLRLARSVGGALHQLADRVTARVHGACVGAGVELPAFAGRVVARADAAFSLPEVGMGLVPGAGGTVSIPRRIGRHRTMELALTGQRIDAATALAWGLVDEVVETFDD